MKERAVNMAKNEERDSSPDVVWTLKGDAMRPMGAPWGFIARNPVQRVISPGSSMEINLQVSANRPMLTFPTRAHSTDVHVVGASNGVLPIGQDVVVVVNNPSAHSPLVVDDGESLICLHPLTFSGTSEVE